MTRTSQCARSQLLLVVLLLVLPGASALAQEKQDPRHRSPKATVRTLLTAITVAQEHPQAIEEAVSCLDPGSQTANQQSPGLLASQLEAVLRARDVDTEVLPDESKAAVYVLPDEHEVRIALERKPDGRWLFDRETVSQIPHLYAEAQKQLQTKNREMAALGVSPNYASPRATVRTLVEGYRRRDVARILSCLDLGDIPAAARQEVGTLQANKLKQILLRQRRIILQEIPNSNYSDPYVWLSQPEGAIELARTPSGSRKGEWLVSQETIRFIDRLYDTYTAKPYHEEFVDMGTSGYAPQLWGEPELWLRGHLPGWLRVRVLSTTHLNIELYELLGYLLVSVLAFGLYRLTLRLLTVCLEGLLVRRGWTLPRGTILKRVRPVSRLAGALFLRWGLVALGPDRILLVPLLVLLNPLIGLLGMWAIFRLMDLLSDLLDANLTAEKRRADAASS